MKKKSIRGNNMVKTNRIDKSEYLIGEYPYRGYQKVKQQYM